MAPVQAWRKFHNSFLFLGWAKLGKNIKLLTKHGEVSPPYSNVIISAFFFF